MRKIRFIRRMILEARSLSRLLVVAWGVGSACVLAEDTPLRPGQVWSGGYICGESEIPLSLTIKNIGNKRKTTASHQETEVEAEFSFKNGGIDGSFDMTGSYQLESGELLLNPTKWIKRPLFYSMVGLNGKITADGKSINGRVTKFAACHSFELSLVKGVSEGDRFQKNGSNNRKSNTSGQNSAGEEVGLGTVSDDEPLSTENLAGEWASVQIRETNTIFNREVIRSEPPFHYIFEKNGTSQYLTSTVRRLKSGPTDGVILTAKKTKSGFTLRMTSFTAAFKSFKEAITEAYWVGLSEPHYSANGVDILTDVTIPTSRKSHYLIRFRSSAAAKELGIASLNYFEFCTGPATKLANLISSEKQSLSVTSKVIESRGYRKSALATGTFGAEQFKAIFGRSFTQLSSSARSTLIERLRTCAIYHIDRRAADLIADLLFGDRFTRVAIQADVGRHLRKNKPLLSGLNAENVVNYLSAAKSAQGNLNDGLESLNAKGTIGDKLIEAEWDLYRNYGAKLPPSAIWREVKQLAVRKNEFERRKMDAKEAELDRTLPPLPETELILVATKNILLKNCSRAFLSLRASSGGGGIATWTANSVEAKRGMCVVNSGTHLLSFNIRSVNRHECMAGDPTACTFTGNWSCRYELNPEFGFSPSTKNIDVVCPLVRSSPIRFKGMFQRKAPRRWIAKSIDWK